MRRAGSGKVKWNYEKVQGIAMAMREHLPLAVRDLIEGPNWRGGAIVRLESDVARPSALEVSRHYFLLKPWVQALPTTVPSAFMITDTLLLLNQLLELKLFPVKPVESVINNAAAEAVKIKKLLQALRYLFRSSGSIADRFTKAGKNSRFTRIADLKHDLRPKEKTPTPTKTEAKTEGDKAVDAEYLASIADEEAAPIADVAVAAWDRGFVSAIPPWQLGDRSEDDEEDFSDKDSMILLAELTSEEEFSDAEDPLDLKLEELQAGMFPPEDPEKTASFAGASDVPSPPSSAGSCSEDMEMIASGKRLPQDTRSGSDMEPHTSPEKDEATDLEKAEQILSEEASQEQTEADVEPKKRRSALKEFPYGNKDARSSRQAGIGPKKRKGQDVHDSSKDSEMQDEQSEAYIGPKKRKEQDADDSSEDSQMQDQQSEAYIGPKKRKDQDADDSSEDSQTQDQQSEAYMGPKKTGDQDAHDSSEDSGDQQSEVDIGPKKTGDQDTHDSTEDQRSESDIGPKKTGDDSTRKDRDASDSDVQGPGESSSEKVLPAIGSPGEDLPSDFDSPGQDEWVKETMLDDDEVDLAAKFWSSSEDDAKDEPPRAHDPKDDPPDIFAAGSPSGYAASAEEDGSSPLGDEADLELDSMLGADGRDDDLTAVGVQKKPTRKKGQAKSRALPKKVKKAGFNRKGGRRKRNKVAKIAKKAKEMEEAATEPCRHGSYDLTALGIPKDALPQGDKANKGAHSYTVASPGNECAVEVLLRNRAFYSKRLATGAPGPRGQVGWATFHGVEAAWSEVKKRVGWSDQ
ncbi:hmu [Symbiodinium sp. CCMP2592]|nr:hmu [Symbiodinium sp. CCMP2592]